MKRLLGKTSIKRMLTIWQVNWIKITIATLVTTNRILVVSRYVGSNPTIRSNTEDNRKQLVVEIKQGVKHAYL